MNTRPVYLGLVIKSEPIDPKDNRDIFDRLARGVPIEGLVITETTNDGLDAIFHDQAIHMVILNISVGSTGLSITFQTASNLPPGLRPGMYTINFPDGHVSRGDKLPTAMYDPNWGKTN